MKSVLASAGLAAVGQAALESCLYCRYTDLRSAWLESWSYCRSNPECLSDVWNYIDRSCEGDWIRGKELSLEQCEIEDAPCPEFVSSKQFDLNEPLGKAKNVTWTLPAGASCIIKVDATEYVGRVLFDDVQGAIGIEGVDPLQLVTEKISFDKTVGEVLIYNANETGSVRFTISFSGATTTLAALATGLLATSLALF